jgi:hypothetical protein
MACENKYSTLLDLARQAKIISGNTACLEGKAQFGIPFSGYPTGPDLSTLNGTAVVSSATAVFSGNSGTTLFDVSNIASPNYISIFSGYSATTWSGNTIFSANTSGLILPITPFSADTQTVGPILFLAETGMTGDHVITTLYTGYTITYSFYEVAGESIDLPPFYSGVTGFTTAVQTNVSAGTLDYKGPLDYVSSKEDLTVENRLTTNKLTVTYGASASTIGYVLTQLDEAGKAGWVFNSSTASTNTFVTGGTLTGTNLDLTWNTGGSVPSIELSGLTFTGNTSGTCITDIHASNIHSCSPLNINPLDEGNVYFGSTSGLTVDLSNIRLGIGTTIPTEKLEVKDGNILVEHDQNERTKIRIKNLSGGTLGGSALSLIVSGLTTESSGSLLSFGVNATPTGTFMGSYLPNSFNITTGGGMVANRQHINIGSRRGTDAQIRFFGGSDDFDSSSLLGIFYTSGLTITDMVNTDTFRIRDGATTGYVLTSDTDGVATWQVSSGGVSLDPYNNVGSASTLTWDVSGTSTNYKITLTGNTTLTMSNVRDGDSGNLIVIQGGGGSHTLTLVGGTHYVVNGGSGSPLPLTTDAGARDILSFTYDGDEPAFYWTVGDNYT